MAFVDVLLGGALAIAGGVIGTTLQARAQREGQAQERDERRREVRRAQAERVYVELHDLCGGYHRQQVVALRGILDVAAPTETLQPVSSANLLGIVSIYFPECLPIVEKFDEAALDIITKDGTKIAEAYVARPDDPKTISKLRYALASKLSKLSSEFSKDLREAMRTEVEKLW